MPPASSDEAACCRNDRTVSMASSANMISCPLGRANFTFSLRKRNSSGQQNCMPLQRIRDWPKHLGVRFETQRERSLLQVLAMTKGSTLGDSQLALERTVALPR